MASNQLRVSCTRNYYSCWDNLLFQTICICLQYGAREFLALTVFGTASPACDAWNHTNQNNFGYERLSLNPQSLSLISLTPPGQICYGMLSNIFFKKIPIVIK